MSSGRDDRREVRAIKVRQWLREWENVDFKEESRRRRPDPFFYLFVLRASDLRTLCGISRRTTKGGLRRAEDLGIQRRHDESRSKLIGDFIRYGYPWSELSERKRQSGEFGDLRKPGWLPTAIVINILKPGDRRRGRQVETEEIVTVSELDATTAVLRFPRGLATPGWTPSGLHPLEVIDGQHRLWAFEETAATGDFELPVVAFHGLDISWQAYLFWTINITPKRINRSLAFDLYPLLRTEDWLDKFEGHPVYRETRAQELTETLWALPESPWHDRINMLGERGLGKAMVTQAAWIRSLMATYVKSWEGRGVTIGGLFGARLGADEEVLPWSRAQQAAFLVFMGQAVMDAIRGCDEDWAHHVRQAPGFDEQANGGDPAFHGAYSLLGTDQGIRGILAVTNDLCYVRARELELQTWVADVDAEASDLDAVRQALNSLKRQSVALFLSSMATRLSQYDWRTSSAPGLNEFERRLKAAFRGSGGYKEIRRALLRHLEGAGGDVGRAAAHVLTALGY